jgi:hypothetical protein
MVIVKAVPDETTSDFSQQTGFKERLLCGACEQRLSGYETSAANQLFNKRLPSPSNPFGRVIVLTGLDYKRVRLFLLSLLWRASIASGRFFKCVKLGPHEPIIHRMLLNKDPGEPMDYGCTVCSLLPEKEIDFAELVFPPVQTRNDDHNGYLFAFREFVFTFYISNHRLSPSIKRSFLSREGTLPIVLMRLATFQPLCDLWNRSVKLIQSAPE